MKLRVVVHVGAIFLILLNSAKLNAQLTHAQAVFAEEESRRQAQNQFDDQLAAMQTRRNEARSPRESQRISLARELQQCYINKNEQGIQATQTADQAKQQASQTLLNSATQGIAPLLQNGFNLTGSKTQTAENDIKEIRATQRLAANNFSTTCGTTGNVILREDGSNASSIVSIAQGATLNPVNPACTKAAQHLANTTLSAKEDIRDAKKQKDEATAQKGQLAVAAIALGIGYKTSSDQKKAAESALNDSNRINKLSYDACVQGINDQVAEIDKELAAIDAQFAADRDRLARQFAQSQGRFPPNIERLAPPPTDDENAIPGIGNMGGAIAGTQFKKPDSPFNALNNKGAGGGGTAAGAAAGGGGSAGEGAKAGYGFGSPYDAVNPALSYTLPTQPDKGGLIGGTGEGGESTGGATDPLGAGFGFEDPFANVSAEGVAKDSGGNGFWELAMKTHRRVYAHLNELLGAPLGGKVLSNKIKKDSDRKITSTKN